MILLGISAFHHVELNTQRAAVIVPELLKTLYLQKQARNDRNALFSKNQFGTLNIIAV